MALNLLGILLKTFPDIPLQTILKSSSQQAEHINRVTNYFFLAAAFILSIVAGLTIFMLVKFHHNKSASKKSKTLSSKWEIPMIGIPLALVAIFFYLNVKTLLAINPDVDNEHPDIVITAHQLWWEGFYPDAGVITANEIHLPAGRRILLKMLSADVIHDWWIPQFGNKMDMVPGNENYLWLTIKQPGEYYGICSEFCGAQHAHMRVKVIAQTVEDYNQWLQYHQRPALNDPTVTVGKRLFLDKTCGNCHRVDGTISISTAGPDLTHFASRKTFLAGMLENNLSNIEDWIKHPQKIKPGAHMPDFLLADSSVKAIARYLNSLK